MVSRLVFGDKPDSLDGRAHKMFVVTVVVIVIIVLVTIVIVNIISRADLFIVNMSW